MQLKKLAFHKSGKPRGWLRKLVISQRRARPLFRRIVHKKNGSVRPAFAPWIEVQHPQLRTWLKHRWAALQPIPVFFERMDQRRITIVTDSIGPLSSFGGVATALILGAQWATRSGAQLRILTRTEAPESLVLSTILDANRVSFTGRVEFRFCSLTGAREVPCGDRDLFLTTSWWTTRSLINSVGLDRVVYLLQEDERMFYAFGDERLECHNTIAAPLRKVIVNTNLLWDHLTKGCDSIDGLSDRGVVFEPAFVTPKQDKFVDYPSNGRKRMFFYARPSNSRNLFATGVAALGAAVEIGTLHPEEWEVHMIGSDIPKMEFPEDLRIVQHGVLPWPKYKALMATMDAGFSLMYTPCPSYPPLDLAAMGTPVLTNRYGVKKDLGIYSDNILCVDLTLDALARGFGPLNDLVASKATQEANKKNDHILRDWGDALKPVVDSLDTLWPESN